MLRLLITSFFACLLVAPAEAGIDLAPVPSNHEEHGMKYRMLTFKHDDRKIEYVPPGGWTARGGGDRLQLSPPDSKFAEASVQAVPQQAPVHMDEARMSALEQQVINSVPVGSQSPAVLESTENPIVLGGQPSFGFVISYHALGQTFYRSFIFVQAADVQLVFRFTAEKSEFEKLYSAFRQSLTSWHWTQPSASK